MTISESLPNKNVSSKSALGPGEADKQAKEKAAWSYLKCLLWPEDEQCFDRLGSEKFGKQSKKVRKSNKLLDGWS